jgi:mannose-6-phosphate isomerase-like protein (cupin superfamily)
MDCVKNARAAAAFAPERMRKVNLFDTPRMFCDVYGLEPGQEQAAHAHAGADKVYVVLDGVGDFRIGDTPHTVPAEHAVLAPAGVPHAVRNSGPGRLILLVFMAPKP